MARANIDLSWLASLLTKTPTAQSNPSYGAADDPSFEGPVQPGQSQPLYAQGGTGAGVPAGADTSHAFIVPSNWQRMMHPEAAQSIDQLNNQAASASVMPSIQNTAALKVRSGNVGLLDPSLQPNTSPISAAAAGYGSLDTSPSYINQQNQSLLTAQHGLPGLKAATDLTTGKYMYNAATGALERQPDEQSILNQDQVNQMRTVYGLTPDQIDLAEQQVSADKRFKPTENSIRTQALQNQANEQNNIVPAQQSLAQTQTENQQKVASQVASDIPYTTGAIHNRDVADLATSKYFPMTGPFMNTVNPDSTVTPFERTPIGTSSIQEQMRTMQDITGNNVQTITLSSGKKMQVMMPTVSRQAFNPLGTPTETASPVVPPVGSTISASSNGPSVTHDQTGSMAPPLSGSQSFSTLPFKDMPTDPQAIQDELDRLEPAAMMYPTSQSGIRYNYLKQHLADMQRNQSLSHSGFMPLSGSFSLPSSLR